MQQETEQQRLERLTKEFKLDLRSSLSDKLSVVRTELHKRVDAVPEIKERDAGLRRSWRSHERIPALERESAELRWLEGRIQMLIDQTNESLV